MNRLKRLIAEIHRRSLPPAIHPAHWPSSIVTGFVTKSAVQASGPEIASVLSGKR